MLMPNFAQRRISSGDIELQVAVGGAGPPVLLLHGFPETHSAWHAVAPRLAERFTVICPDLRGYGESDKPADDEGHERYAKRTMARDLVTLMNGLGHARFAVAGHDRGAVVAYRLALDHSTAVTKLAVMSVLPVLEQWDTLHGQAGVGAYHLSFLAQPADLPERLVGADPDRFFQSFLDGWCATPGAIVEEARTAYARAWRDPRTIHAICADYRANASIDVAHDRADQAAGRRITAPMLVLWERPPGGELPFSPLEVWRRWADDVREFAVDGGHFLPEERSDEVAGALESFFA